MSDQRTPKTESPPDPDSGASDVSPAADQAHGASLRHRLYKVPVLGAITYLLFPPRTKDPTILRRFVSWSSAIVAVLGIAMVAYPWAGEKYPFFLKVPVEKLIEWSNFWNDMQTNRIQDDLAKQFAGMSDTGGARDGEPLTRIVIPKLGVDTIVVEGTSPRALKAGAGHYPQTPLPGQAGNVSIAGHRTTYGRPFNKVDKLKVGDRIVLVSPVGKYTYEVTRDPWITDPTDWSVIDVGGSEPLLTLTSCHPKGSDRQRIIVRAKLVRSEAVAAGEHAA